jgi:hypothetical protein
MSNCEIVLQTHGLKRSSLVLPDRGECGKADVGKLPPSRWELASTLRFLLTGGMPAVSVSVVAVLHNRQKVGPMDPYVSAICI